MCQIYIYVIISKQVEIYIYIWFCLFAIIFLTERQKYLLNISKYIFDWVVIDMIFYLLPTYEFSF